MSSNWISNGTENVEKKWCNIRANSVSIGQFPLTLNTQTYTPTILADDVVVGNIYPLYYHSNGKSLFLSGTFDITSKSTLNINQFDVFLSIPPETLTLFQNQTLFGFGYLTQQDNNTLVNQGLISSVDWNLGTTLKIQVMFSKANTTATPYRIRYNIQIHR
jgi:hypothetical protein